MHPDGCPELFLRKPFASHARGKKKRIARTAVKLDNLKNFYDVNCGLTAKYVFFNYYNIKNEGKQTSAFLHSLLRVLAACAQAYSHLSAFAFEYLTLFHERSVVLDLS